MRERRKDLKKTNQILITLSVALFFMGGTFLWFASLRVPSLEDFSGRKVLQSTKIFDKTGEILLYDMSRDVRRTIVPFENISTNIKRATLAIEDQDFYSHNGVKFSSLARAILVDVATLSFSQGGSTITQQVVKNSILTNDKTPTRKIKEWILASKLEKVFTKDQILGLYLNEAPYGGAMYGVEEASRSFYNKPASDVTLAEAAYMAALTQAPTYFSPYGKHRDRLEARKNLVLSEMLENGFINKEEYDGALAEVVEFKPRVTTTGIKAPHFVFYVINELADIYGEESLEKGGMKVVTTLDYSIQEAAEKIGEKYGQINQKQFNADNNAIVVMDPKTGGVLAMTGSRDYFDEAISGNFNVATSHRQPGSTFKPIVYAALFNKGYTPETILFDVPTQFNSSCPATQLNSEDGCYGPGNYDDKFRGPMTVRNALAQSINVPAVKALYLAGMNNTLDLARILGIEGLGEAKQYGLSLVLGGGEVTLLDMVSAYSVFANDGIKNSSNVVLRMENQNGTVVDEFTPASTRVIPEETARNISSILSDNGARTPSYGSNSLLYVPDRPVAVKTGTTNDYKDAWIIGYAPNIVVGAWVGNNDNTPMEKKVAGFIVAPMWRELVNEILPSLAVEYFTPPPGIDTSLKPVLRGVWQGGYSSFSSDGNSGGESIGGGIHNILHWIDRNDPRGPIPSNPGGDSQYSNWEAGVRRWAEGGGYGDGGIFIPAPAPQPEILIDPVTGLPVDMGGGLIIPAPTDEELNAQSTTTDADTNNSGTRRRKRDR
ncbi:MAG: PBP1A family penicillin-binding protein [bacterium]|nr:PBP1A family penicillin-binding protein [bacterium]